MTGMRIAMQSDIVLQRIPYRGYELQQIKLGDLQTTEWRVMRGSEHDATAESETHAKFHVDELIQDQEFLKTELSNQGNT
jgi:hypothetical protein